MCECVCVLIQLLFTAIWWWYKLRAFMKGNMFILGFDEIMKIPCLNSSFIISYGVFFLLSSIMSSVCQRIDLHSRTNSAPFWKQNMQQLL